MPKPLKLYQFLLDAIASDDNSDECLVWPFSTAGGYGQVSCGNYTTRKVHVVAYEVGVGPIPDGMIVRHACDNPPCFRRRHLLIGNHKDNVRDALERGRWFMPKGSLHNMAKLSEEDVLAIRSRFAENPYHGHQKKLAQEFEISRAVICNILGRKIWTHI
jgi:hypothetical protein